MINLICSLNILYSLYGTMFSIIFVRRSAAAWDSISFAALHWQIIGWQPLFSKKVAAAASFSFKIGSGRQYLATLLAAVLTWSGYCILVIGILLYDIVPCIKVCVRLTVKVQFSSVAKIRQLLLNGNLKTVIYVIERWYRGSGKPLV